MLSQLHAHSMQALKNRTVRANSSRRGLVKTNERAREWAAIIKHN